MDKHDLLETLLDEISVAATERNLPPRAVAAELVGGAVRRVRRRALLKKLAPWSAFGVVTASLLAGGLVYSSTPVGTCTSQISPSYDGTNGFITFCANTPAVANEMNHNFAQVITYLQQKVGTVGTADISTTGNVTASGNASFGGTLSVTSNVLTDLSLTNSSGNRYVKVNSSSAKESGLVLQSSGATRWSVLSDNTAGVVGVTDSGSNFEIDRYSDSGTNQGAALFVERDNGYVGIGTTLPLYALTVKGGIYSSGQILAQSSVFGTSLSTSGGISSSVTKTTVTANDDTGYQSYGAGYNESWADCGNNVVTGVRLVHSASTGQMLVEVNCAK